MKVISEMEKQVAPMEEKAQAEYRIAVDLARKGNISNEPYVFKWSPTICSMYKIKVKAVDNSGQSAEDNDRSASASGFPAHVRGYVLFISGPPL